MDKSRILVVEDESIVALDIKRTLESLGYVVSATASSGEKAIQKAAETEPDLVLMDIVQAAEQIRSRFDIPVVYLTAHSDEATIQRAKITEPFGYLLKPFEERDLHTTIEMSLYKHKTEMRLKESERWLTTTLQSMADGVIATDAQGRIKFVNPVAETLTGWSRSGALGRDLSEVFNIIHERTRTPVENPVTKVLQEGVVVGMGNHTILISKEGTEIPINDNAAPIRDEQGNISGVVLIFKDVSQQVHAEEEIRSRNRELALLNKIIAASAAGLEPESVLEIACRELAVALDVPQVTAALLNEDKTAAVVIAEHLAEDRPSSLTNTIWVAEDVLLQRLLDHGAPLVMDTPVSLLAVPLLIEGAVVGSLCMEATEPRAFTEGEVKLAWSVADQAASALDRALLDSERHRLGAAIEQADECVMITDTEGALVYVNPAFERVTGYTRAEVVGLNPRLLNSGEQDDAFYAQLWATLTAGKVWHGRLVNQRKDGALYTADTTITPVRDENGNTVNYISLQRDVTRELQLEEQYHQTQKLNAIGQLTAGIAHDFNNLLTVMNGFAELIQVQLLPDHPLQDSAEKILSAGRRAAGLVSQLLAFSRRQVLQPKVLDLNAVVAEMDKMLGRVIGDHIQVETILASDLWTVKVDPTKMEQVIVNLAVNARDAMPEGGKLTIESANVLLGEDYDSFEDFAAEQLEPEPGEYVLLTVSDTGVGMSDEVKAHIFEPFFTTKKLGEGTGLGLATVHGIVSQSGGHIRVFSQEGHGTTFRIYLPCASEAATQLDGPGLGKDIPSGAETILLVEDDAAVRELARQVLQTYGYNLLEAQDGYEALQLAASHSEPIQLLLTDVVMPGLNGKDLSSQLTQAQPDLRSLFMSGYPDEAIARHGVLDPSVAFLQKPFSPAALARKVRDVLDGANMDL